MNVRVIAAIGIALLAGGCGHGEKHQAAGPAKGASTYQQAVAFAKCMRTHGDPSFPDPGPEGAFPNDNGSLKKDSPQFKTAAAACKKFEPGSPPQSVFQQDYRQAPEVLRLHARPRAAQVPGPGPGGPRRGLRGRRRQPEHSAVQGRPPGLPVARAGGHVSTAVRWAVAAAVTAAVAIAIVAVHDREPAAEPTPTYPTSTAPVDRRELVSATRVAATWGYAGEHTVVNQAPGIVTTLPKVGQVVRQGQVLYRVSGRPVVLLYGPVPAYRTLSYGMTGRDVTALNTALAKLGYGWARHSFGLETVRALERLQHHLGVARTGELALGDAVFLPRAARVTARQAVPGAPARPGMALLSASETRPIVTVDLDAAQQTQVRKGDKVTITLPAGRTTPGVVPRSARWPRSGPRQHAHDHRRGDPRPTRARSRWTRRPCRSRS